MNFTKCISTRAKELTDRIRNISYSAELIFWWCQSTRDQDVPTVVARSLSRLGSESRRGLSETSTSIQPCGDQNIHRKSTSIVSECSDESSIAQENPVVPASHPYFQLDTKVEMGYFVASR